MVSKARSMQMDDTIIITLIDNEEDDRSWAYSLLRGVAWILDAESAACDSIRLVPSNVNG
jgi:hypothetical protein